MLLYITIEQRKKAIDWINGQDVFRSCNLFAEFDTDHTKKLGGCLQQIVASANRKGYLQRIEKGRYMLIAQIPHDMVVNANAKWEEPKM